MMESFFLIWLINFIFNPKKTLQKILSQLWNFRFMWNDDVASKFSMHGYQIRILQVIW